MLTRSSPTTRSLPAERYKRINNEMLILGPRDSDSHTPLLVYIRSLAADQERNFHHKKEAEDMQATPIAATVGTRRSDEIR